MSRFEGKKVLVTGGTSGIGLATAKRLAAEGAQVAVTGTNAERLRAAEEAIPGVLAIQNDAADPTAAEALGQEISRHWGALDAAYLNAGFGRFAPLEEVTAEDFDGQYAVNVRGPLLHAKALSPLLSEGGALLLNTSVARDMGLPASTIYSSTKGAVRTLVRVLARELAGRQVRVNAVSPGPIASDFFARTGMPEEAQQEVGASILSQVPLGRFGTPEEVAAVATFLLSEDASFVSGSEYVVDGGMTEM